MELKTYGLNYIISGRMACVVGKRYVPNVSQHSPKPFLPRQPNPGGSPRRAQSLLRRMKHMVQCASLIDTLHAYNTE